MTHSQKISWAVTYSVLTVFGFVLFFILQVAMQFSGAALTLVFWQWVFVEPELWSWAFLLMTVVLFAGIIAAPICVVCGKDKPLFALMTADIVVRVALLAYRLLYDREYLHYFVPGLVTAVIVLAVTVWQFRQPVKAESEAL